MFISVMLVAMLLALRSCYAHLCGMESCVIPAAHSTVHHSTKRAG